jgi:hypothetical protein
MTLTTVNAGMLDTQAQYNGFKNRIINGAMVIDQRNAGASVTPTNGQYLIDRWYANQGTASKFSAQQNAGSVTPPAGFINYLGATSLSAYSVSAGDVFALVQVVEGLNIADLGWGTASAQTVTLSFWVRSSLTGTFGGCANNSAQNRSYPFSYTISSANTWEQKTITITGDTTGTWLTTNGGGIRIYFSIGSGTTYQGTAGAWAGATYTTATGATSVVATNGATFYITGVQLEKGSTATSFDYRPYGTELALCQRYFYAPANRTTAGVLRINAVSNGFLPVEMRAVPTMTVYGTGGWTGANSGKYDQDGVGDTNATITAGLCTREFRVTPSSGSVGNASYKAEAEL